jgi:ATP-dependent DNA helicase RecG
MNISSPIEYVKTVGPKRAKLFNKLSIYTVKDLIYYLPKTYEDRRQLPSISGVIPDTVQTIVGVVESISERKVNGSISVVECRVSDRSGSLVAVWFNQAYIKKILKPYSHILIKGKVSINLFQKVKQLAVSETEILYDSASIKENVGCIVPVYGLTNGMYQSYIRTAIKQVKHLISQQIQEILPSQILHVMNLPEITTSLMNIHHPTSDIELKKARQRLIFEEFFVYQLKLLKKRSKRKTDIISPALNSQTNKLIKYIKKLPYTLTKAQKKAIYDIQEDVKKRVPMNRLIQGDVGCGKTDVAVAGLLMAIGSGYSGVLMAPTEILATQHYTKMKSTLETLGVTVYLLKGKMSKKKKKETLENIQKKPCVLIGTHAILEDPVTINTIGLIIIDEQHRFGVIQRLKIQKKQNPHCLYLTATPIPRSFMLTSFGDLDKTIMDEMPPGRIPVTTYFINEENQDKANNYCISELKKGHQLYIVYPLIKESEKIDLKSAIEGYEKATRQFNTFKVGLLHGKMNAKDKALIMDDFKKNNLQILVSTTVIEVGIDIPNATIMIINHAERFGLSQLHQLRGRIGRGGNKSICFLIGNPKTDTGKQRLKAMVNTNDGFKLAEIDLKIRGPGDMLGTKQSGLPEFKCGDIIKDESILLSARNIAKSLLEKDPELENPEYIRLKKHLTSTQSPIIEADLN